MDEQVRDEEGMTTEKTLDVVLLTDPRYESPVEVDWYVGNILREDELLASALAQHGLRARRVAWSRPDFDWASTRAALFRTTWDYFDRFAEFTAWFERTAPLTPFLNPASLVRWNWDKHYLLDLEQRGIAIPPTVLMEAGTRTSLPEVFASTGWAEAILKPAVSGAGRHTHRLDARGAVELDPLFQSLIAQEAMLLQRFEEAILTAGEIALMVIGGRCTHAVQKIAKPGDFRVHDDYGGTVHPYTPGADEIAFAEACVAACPTRPVYARVDYLRDTGGQLKLIELELIEPELFFRFHPLAAEALAAEVARWLGAAIS